MMAGELPPGMLWNDVRGWYLPDAPARPLLADPTAASAGEGRVSAQTAGEIAEIMIAGLAKGEGAHPGLWEVKNLAQDYILLLERSIAQDALLATTLAKLEEVEAVLKPFAAVGHVHNRRYPTDRDAGVVFRLGDAPITAWDFRRAAALIAEVAREPQEDGA